jgi:hypothetical protein
MLSHEWQAYICPIGLSLIATYANLAAWCNLAPRVITARPTELNFPVHIQQPVEPQRMIESLNSCSLVCK